MTQHRFATRLACMAADRCVCLVIVAFYMAIGVAH